jgi:hypothetical protein
MVRGGPELTRFEAWLSPNHFDPSRSSRLLWLPKELSARIAEFVVRTVDHDAGGIEAQSDKSHRSAMSARTVSRRQH